MPIIGKQSLGKQLRSWGSTVQCSRLAGPGVVLLGDAGHGVTANLGQGCNAALESVGVLDKVRSPLRCAQSVCKTSVKPDAIWDAVPLALV